MAQHITGTVSILDWIGITLRLECSLTLVETKRSKTNLINCMTRSCLQLCALSGPKQHQEDPESPGFSVPRPLQHVSFRCGGERKWNGKKNPSSTHCSHMVREESSQPGARRPQSSIFVVSFLLAAVWGARLTSALCNAVAVAEASPNTVRRTALSLLLHYAYHPIFHTHPHTHAHNSHVYFRAEGMSSFTGMKNRVLHISKAAYHTHTKTG